MSAAAPSALAADLERKNVENLLKKQLAGKVLTEEEKDAIIQWTAKQQTGERPEKRKLRLLTPQTSAFVKLQIEGLTAGEAYKRAYAKPHLDDVQASKNAHKINLRPNVIATLEELRKQSTAPMLMSLNDRFAILTEIGTAKTAKKSDRIRAVEVYTKIAGDGAAEKHDHRVVSPLVGSFTALLGEVDGAKQEKL